MFIVRLKLMVWIDKLTKTLALGAAVSTFLQNFQSLCFFWKYITNYLCTIGGKWLKNACQPFFKSIYLFLKALEGTLLAGSNSRRNRFSGETPMMRVSVVSVRAGMGVVPTFVAKDMGGDRHTEEECSASVIVIMITSTLIGLFWFHWCRLRF